MEQKEIFLNHLAQQEVQFDQMMELLTEMKEVDEKLESPQNTSSQAQPRWSEFRSFKERKVDLMKIRNPQMITLNRQRTMESRK